MAQARGIPWLARAIYAIQRILAWERSFLLGERVWDFGPALTLKGLTAAIDKRFQRSSEGGGKIVWGPRWRSPRLCLQAPDRIDVSQGAWSPLRSYVGWMYFEGRLEDGYGGKTLTGQFRHPKISRAFNLAFIKGVMAWLLIAAVSTAFNAFSCVLSGGEACKYALNGMTILALGAPLSILMLGVLRLMYRLSGLHREKTHSLLAGIAKDAANETGN